MSGEREHLIQLFKIMNDSSSTNTRVREKQTKLFLQVLKRIAPNYLSLNTGFVKELHDQLPQLTYSYAYQYLKHYLFFATLLWLGQDAFLEFVTTVKRANADIVSSLIKIDRLGGNDRHGGDFPWKHGESKTFVYSDEETIIGLASHYLDNKTFNDIFLEDIAKINSNELITQPFLIGTLAIKGNTSALKKILEAAESPVLLMCALVQIPSRCKAEAPSALVILAEHAPKLLREILPGLLEVESNAESLKKFVALNLDKSSLKKEAAFFEALPAFQSWEHIITFAGGNSTSQNIAMDNMAIYFSNLHKGAFAALEVRIQKNPLLTAQQRNTLLKGIITRNTLLNMFVYLLERPGRRITREGTHTAELLNNKDQHDFTQRFNDFLNIITVILSTSGEDLQKKLLPYIAATQVNFKGFFSNEYQNLRGQLLSLDSEELRIACNYLKIFLAKRRLFSLPEAMQGIEKELITRVQARIAYTECELPRNTRPDEIFPVTPLKHRLMQLRQLVEEKKETDFLEALDNETDANLVAHFACEYFNFNPPFNLLEAVLASFSEDTFLKLYEKIITQLSPDALRDMLFSQEGKKLLSKLLVRVDDKNLEKIISLKKDVFSEIFIRIIKEEAQLLKKNSGAFTSESKLVRKLIIRILLKSPEELFKSLAKEFEAEIKIIFSSSTLTIITPTKKLGHDALEELATEFKFSMAYPSESNTNDMLLEMLLQDDSSIRVQQIISLVIEHVVATYGIFFKLTFFVMAQTLPYTILAQSFSLLKSSAERRKMPSNYSYFINQKQYQLIKKVIEKNPQLSAQEKLRLKFDILIGALLQKGIYKENNTLLHLIADPQFKSDFIVFWLEKNLSSSFLYMSFDSKELSKEFANYFRENFANYFRENKDEERQLFKQVLAEYQKYPLNEENSADKQLKWDASKKNLLAEQEEYLVKLSASEKVLEKIFIPIRQEQKLIALHEKAVEKYGSFQKEADKGNFVKWYIQLSASLREDKINAFLNLIKPYTRKMLYSKDDFSKHLEDLERSITSSSFAELVAQHSEYARLLLDWKNDLVNHSSLEIEFIRAVEAPVSSTNKEELELRTFTPKGP